MDDNKLKDSIKSAVDNNKTDYFDEMSEFKPNPENFYHKSSNSDEGNNNNNKNKKRYRNSMFAVAACLVLVFALVLNSGVLKKNDSLLKDNSISADGNGNASSFSFDGKERNVKKVDTIEVDKDYKNLEEEIDKTYGEASRYMYEMEDEDFMPFEEMQEAEASMAEEPAVGPFRDGDTIETGATPEPSADAPVYDEAGVQEELPDIYNDVAPMASSEDITGGSAEYSETNIQVEGVDEADIIKTDGEYIYTLSNKNICIVKAGDGNPELLSKIAQDVSDMNSNKYCDIYISGDRLVAIKQGYGGTLKYPDGSTRNETGVDIFDISDRSNPVKMGGFGQSGYYSTSRLIGKTLYLISSYSEMFYNPSEEEEIEPSNFVPLIMEDNETSACVADSIRIMPESDFPAYTLIRSIDIENVKGIAEESLLGDAGEVYCSSNNIYITSYKYNDDVQEVDGGTMYISSDSTIVSKYSINKGEIDYVASASIPGSILNQFSMDEYDGNFRMVTSEYDSYWIERDSYNYDAPYPYSEDDYGEKVYNSLYVLDENLEQIGSVEELAPDENVYSCRFMGEMAYFVTFRQVDPLFSVDLSDPTNPTVIGKLKIPGFSEYLHPYDDGLLFGLGRDADENTGMVQSLKLTMFDNSDPTDVKEKDTFILGDENYSPAESNHKAILINKDKKIIAFPTEYSYKITTYDDEKGFELLVDIVLDQTNPNSYYTFAEIRGLFIGDVFYVISPNTIKTFDMENEFEPISSLQIDEGASSVFGGGLITPFDMPVAVDDSMPFEDVFPDGEPIPEGGEFWEE